MAEARADEPIDITEHCAPRYGDSVLLVPEKVAGVPAIRVSVRLRERAINDKTILTHSPESMPTHGFNLGVLDDFLSNHVGVPLEKFTQLLLRHMRRR